MVGAAEARAKPINQLGGKHVLVLERHILIARTLLGGRHRDLDERRPVDMAVVDGVAAEERIPVREPMVDPALPEVLIRRLRQREQILADASAEIPAVRQWEQRA